MRASLLALPLVHGAAEPGHRGDELLHLLVALALLQTRPHTVADVIVERVETDRLHRFGDRVELGEISRQ